LHRRKRSVQCACQSDGQEQRLAIAAYGLRDSAVELFEKGIESAILPADMFPFDSHLLSPLPGYFK
jgi:hypothetical protein